jgi:hypothetical protein
LWLRDYGRHRLFCPHEAPSKAIRLASSATPIFYVASAAMTAAFDGFQ